MSVIEDYAAVWNTILTEFVPGCVAASVEFQDSVHKDIITIKVKAWSNLSGRKGVGTVIVNLITELLEKQEIIEHAITEAYYACPYTAKYVGFLKNEPRRDSYIPWP